jgi:hypothetical protein
MEGREKATDLGVKFVPKSKPAKHGMAFPSIPQHSPVAESPTPPAESSSKFPQSAHSIVETLTF